MNGPILVFGAGGQVGRELTALARHRDVAAVGLTRVEVDIGDAVAVEAAIRRHVPAILVNAAAYTAVDRAESEPDLARVSNVIGPAVLAEAGARARVPLVHLSTDYVFDGTKQGPYTESDPVNPLGVYGHTKAEGEARVRAMQPHHVILRTAWAYGVYGQNFLKTILRLAAERDELRVVADQIGCPTSTADIAEAILALAPRLAADAQRSGTFHFTGSGETTWHDFATEIVAQQRPYTGRNPRVIAISTAEYPTPTRRPPNSVLDCRRFIAAFGYTPPAWQVRVREAVEQLLQTQRAMAQ